MIKELLEERCLPPLKSREEMIEILCREEYGILPNIKFELSVENNSYPRSVCLNTVNYDQIKLNIKTENGEHSLPVFRLLHKDGQPRPTIIYIDFDTHMKPIYFPAELIGERDVNVLMFNYKEATTDDGDFSNGVAPLLLPNGRQKPTDIGKIALWAWTAMRVLDYAETLPEVDMNNVGVLGHSRLGKTALVAAMLDTRFKFAFSNNSGCSGESLSRGSSGINFRGEDGKPTRGENIHDITTHFPFWFCENYFKYAETCIPEGFDQHYLLASIAPRYVYAGSSSLDYWADPTSTYLCLAAASEMWEKEGLSGFVHPDRLPKIGEHFHEGHVGHHIKNSTHLLSYHDWMKYIDFMKSKIN